MTWWHRLRHRRQMEEQLEKELRFHVDEHVTDLINRGHSPEEARRLARIALGGPEQVKEECRDARGTRWFEDLVHDIRYAFRALRQNKGFAAVALLTLALGTGATTLMFTVINGVLLKPLAYPSPETLLSLQEQTNWSSQFGSLWAFTYPNFLDCKRDARSLDMAAWRFVGGIVSGLGEAEYINGRQVSANLFSVLGVPLLQGRAFLPEEDQPGAEPVAIISSNLWQRYGASSTALGMPVVFDGRTYTVIGIAPPDLRLGGVPDIFIPLGQDISPGMLNRGIHSLLVWARLRSNATLTDARAELAVIGRRLAQQYPESNRGRTFIADPLRPNVDNVRSTLWLLLGAVSLVLLIACANIASLFLARSVSRERELAVRAALGAGGGRLVRQCLTESAVLALSGGALGILLATVGVRPFITFWPGSLPRAEEIQIDWQVLAFSLAVSLASGMIFSLAPSLRLRSLDLEHTLRAGGRSIAGSRRLHTGFVIAEMSLAVVLLVSAGMLGRTLLHLSSLDPGLNLQNVVTARVALSPGTLSDASRTRASWQDVLDRARQLPGVQAVAMVDTVPMRQGNNPIGYRTSAAEVPRNEQPLALANSVSPDYLDVMSIPLRRGRFFTDQDRLGSEGVIVIDEVLAQQAFGGQDPIGKKLWIGLDSDPFSVVGIVGHVRYWGPAGDDSAQVRAQVYYPFAQVPDRLVRRWSELMSIAVRTRGEPLSIVEPLRNEIRGVTGDQVIYEVRTLEELAGATLARQRFLVLLFGMFAALALVLACVGIYGVLAYLTGQRVPEIGVRMALGANTRGVIWLVLRQSLVMILVGIAVGSFAAIAAGRLLQRVVEGMQPTEPFTFFIMTGTLVVAALFASLVPAHRASRVDPIRALHQE
jgi:predicted permease